jgi:predicted membrane chloride channel (bestrophin family)
VSWPGRQQTLWRHSCRKLSESPFPFPWAQSITIILFIFLCSLPFIVIDFATSCTVSVLTTFVSVQTYIMLNEVARDMEDPFLYDPNQLPLPQLQYKLNERLIAVSRAERPTAFTDVTAMVAPSNVPPAALPYLVRL